MGKRSIVIYNGQNALALRGLYLAAGISAVSQAVLAFTIGPWWLGLVGVVVCLQVLWIIRRVIISRRRLQMLIEDAERVRLESSRRQ